MLTGMNDVVPRVAETAALVAIGFNIKQSGLLNAGDGKVFGAVKVLLFSFVYTQCTATFRLQSRSQPT